ncbi:uncharacterized protein NESG_01408 [Nematocida ausubeli]|uniref:Mediator of RNA polymerase II transcription subunit 14 n=1 Tax=Nematocida ausubeli (strain ATCC PRA-371 / ERTm2) TaxID=1913371 RepID=A0A086J2C0_NEMA1|nr:uncharacterized protein NESG_01408 [Nematocida ausubeli]KAI5150558.1 hypothetical protein NEAUS05_2216 [Nematocida ausubeli]KAI5150595.1 hypothetical protein NEAUS05_2227 [Nematocida ausubeli]KFG26288.1 hypothetical protein NESG_01408 [Nematocida ausubeli]
MKVRVKLSPKRESLNVRISTIILNQIEPKTTSINEIILNKMKYLLNHIYLINIEDVKEQEKRRQLIRLYIKETNEIIKIVTMVLAIKHSHKINSLERKILRLQKYNMEQEELADKLVYLCNDLKMGVSSSFDVSKAFSVLLTGKSDFSTEIIRMAETLSKENEVNPGENALGTVKDEDIENYRRLDQILILNVKRSGIWNNENVSYTVKNGVLELFSYGFKSKLILMMVNNLYTWQVLSIKHLDDTKNIPIKGIVFNNTIKEIVHMTKYTDSVIKIEEIFKILRNRADSKIFDMEITGTTKSFTATILGIFKISFTVGSSWDGPGIICHAIYKGTRKLVRDDFIERSFSVLNENLKSTISEHARISFEKGLFYKDKPIFTLRDLQKEAQQETGIYRINIPGVIIKEKTNIIYAGRALQLNIYMRMNGNVFVGLHWSADKKMARIFYGLHQSGTLQTGIELPIRYINPVGSNIQIEKTAEKNQNEQKNNNLKNNGNYHIESIPEDIPGSFILETPSSSSNLINRILQTPQHILLAVSAFYTAQKNKFTAPFRLVIKETGIFLIFAEITVYLGAVEGNNINMKIISPRVNIQDPLSLDIFLQIIWLAIVAQVPGRISVHGKLHEDGSLTLHDNISLTVTYSNRSLVASSSNSIACTWADSVLREHSRAACISFFANHKILLFPGLITTLPLHGTLGGSLQKTCKTSILYKVGQKIEVFWEERSSEIEESMKDIPKISQSEKTAVFQLEYLDKVLTAISKLLSIERLQVLGSSVRIQTESQEYAVYKMELVGHKLKAQRIEGNIFVSEAIITDILENSPCPDRTLLEHNLYLTPQK